MKNKSIRYYFFTSITVVLVASVLVMGLVQTILSTNYFQQEKQGYLNQITEVVAEGVYEGQIKMDAGSFSALAYISRVSDDDLMLAGPSGQVVYSVGRHTVPAGSQLPKEVMNTLRDGGGYSETSTLGGLFKENHYNVGVPLLGGGGQMLGYVFASSETASLNVYLTDMLSTFVLSSVLVILISSVLSLLLYNRTILPIRRIALAAHRFGEGDYSARVPVEGDDELTQLAITFNEMANSFEATDTSRRSFMGNIAHELRTPMTSIKGFIDGMLDGTIPAGQQGKYLAIVSDEVGRLARLTKNMLDISRIEAGEYEPTIVDFDIRQTATSVFLSNEQRLSEREITVEGLAGEPVFVYGDQDFTHQVLFNLIDNAIKFVNDGGTITLDIQTPRNNVNVGIRNTGEGVPPEALGHVFDRFYKADKSRGVNTRGAGLGLHISKVLMAQMNGRIWAESEEGVWTEFIFSLPAAQPKKARTRPAPKRGQNPPNGVR